MGPVITVISSASYAGRGTEAPARLRPAGSAWSRAVQIEAARGSVRADLWAEAAKFCRSFPPGSRNPPDAGEPQGCSTGGAPTTRASSPRSCRPCLPCATGCSGRCRCCTTESQLYDVRSKNLSSSALRSDTNRFSLAGTPPDSDVPPPRLVRQPYYYFFIKWSDE